MKRNEESPPFNDNDNDNSKNLSSINVENRIINIHGEINHETSALISENIKELDTGVITVKINSNGGLYSSALSIITDLRNCKNKVVTDIRGMAFSAAAYIALCGNRRKISKFGMILYHYPSGGLEGSESLNDMETFTNASRENYERVVGILLKDTNLTMEKYLKMSERDLYLTPKEAKKLKVVHDIY